ncbi:MAG TPA: hypothetical protein RMG45_04165, partial [Polyangiaceae bacterium LLY-WYZ-15_(1-7)]|nr:hypothetical protein [Polyangiaceae bacterium LLY-WYZ-15_(1-7)]
MNLWRPKSDPTKKPAAALAQKAAQKAAQKDVEAGEREAKELADVLPKSWAEMRSFVDDLREKAEKKDADSLKGLFRDVAEAAAERLKGWVDADRALMLAM